MSEMWVAVRCVFEHPARDAASRLFEERITPWRAASLDDAIARAEREAAEYGRNVDAEPLGLAQAYELSDPPIQGAEVFSLMRESDLDADTYIDRFFDTGTEREERTEE